MADPYYRYGALADRGVHNFPGYITSSSEAAPQSTYTKHHFRDSASDFLRREISPLQQQQTVSYHGLDTTTRNDNNIPVSISGAITGGASSKDYLPPLINEPTLPIHRRETSLNLTTTTTPPPPPAIPDVINDRPPNSNSLRMNGGDGAPSVSRTESNILFVDCLPTDCTRREVGHLFRPFIGYKDIKVIHKQPRRSGDKAMVFCFVEFVDAKCAITAMEALQGYKFDDKKPNSPVLRVHFAQFPFRPPQNCDEHRV